MVRLKRLAAELESDLVNYSPRKTSRRAAESGNEAEGSESEVVEQVTTAKRKRGRPSTTSKLEASQRRTTKSDYDVPSEDDGERGNGAAAETPKKQRTKRDQDLAKPPGGNSRTPQKGKSEPTATEAPSQKAWTMAKGETPAWRRNDQSARKKSARALIEKVVAGNASGEDDDEEITREIYESDEHDDEYGELQDGDRINDLTVTPSKKTRGRKKGFTARARKKSPTPPRDLPPHELYFLQNRTGPSKTSGNNLASLQLLTHEEYFLIWNKYKDPHREDVQFLQDLHADSFPQWLFELSQGFSICCYGYGSKRPLLHRFAKYAYDAVSDHIRNKIVIINGYVRNTSIREILSTVGSAVDPLYRPPAGNPSAMLDDVRSLLSSHDIDITIILNSVDAIPLRKPGMQAILAQLASHPSVQLICSADTPDFTLLWDSGLRSAFNFAFHDCTTFAPFATEIDVVDDVHELLGRKARRAGGKEGVAYVLRSLPENAKNLFRLLVTEILVAMEDDDVASGDNPGVEYRILYSKAVEEFICSSEMAFRTLLKEFVNPDEVSVTLANSVTGSMITK